MRQVSHRPQPPTCTSTLSTDTGSNWQPGDKVIVHPSVQGEKVKELFGDDVETVYPYLRFTSDPSKKKAAATNATK